ncbi:hypothetical protein ACFS2C_03840 [Prauserella oleivorans]|uniref:Uncharacterized protein n=1 Tax=Prauserella oleivorans TaxID=1478153 RepID=A0ABW5W7N3_9PSEU
MKSGFVRAVVALVAGALLAVAAPGLAAATPADGGGKGSSSTEAVGQRLLELRDQLTTVAYNGDVQGTRHTLAELDPVLADLAGGAVKVRSEARNQAAVAKGQQEEVSAVLADPSAKPRTYSDEGRQLPPLPDPLTMVNGLLQSLLQTLQGLLSSLLGQVPAPPVPVPAP